MWKEKSGYKVVVMCCRTVKYPQGMPEHSEKWGCELDRALSTFMATFGRFSQV